MTVINNRIKFKELQIGQIYRSEKFPHADLKVDYIADDMGDGYRICWSCANDNAFKDFCMEKLGRIENTYPYAYAGECGLKAFDKRLKKYGLKLENN